MQLDDLIFVGFSGKVAALHRSSGELVWANQNLHRGYVTLLLDGDRLIASSNGYMYCLHPLTGDILWHNPLKGFGVGVGSIVSVRGQSIHSGSVAAAAADAEAASSAAGAT